MRVRAIIWSVRDDGRTNFDTPRRYVEWEGEPPAVGDSVDISGSPVTVERRHWVSADEMRLMCKVTTAMWPYNAEDFAEVSR